MRLTPCLAVFMMLAPALASEPFDAAREALVAEADELIVAGAAVGRGAQPSRFCKLVQRLTAAASPDQLEALVGHDHVVVRAAGLVGLADRVGPQAIPILESRRASEAKLRFQPRGCLVGEITEGELATRLLLDAHALTRLGQPRPLIEVPLDAGEPKPRRRDWALAALRIEAEGRLTVSGSAVGFAGTPGRFYVLVQELVATGDRALFESLIGDDDVVVRAAGLVGLAQTAPTEVAVEALRGRLSSDAAIDYQPSGCAVMRATEADLARALLENANALDSLQPRRPLAR